MGALWRLAVVVDLDLVAGVCSFCIVALGRRRVGFPVGRYLSGEGVVGAGLPILRKSIAKKSPR